jgi:membrane fusion protein (multidrug efflux system)
MDSPPQSTPIPPRQRKPLLAGLTLLVLLAAVGAGGYYWQVARFYEHTDDAYVAANVVTVMPQVAGTVTAVQVRETQHVAAGQTLVTLDEADTQIALQGAEAELARTVRDIRMVYATNDTLAADIAVRRADVMHAATEVRKAEEDLATRQALISSGAVGKEELKHAAAALRTARAARAAAQAGIGAATERLGANRALTDGTSVAQHPSVLRAAARVREAYLAWQRTRILAPVNGDVAKRVVQVGQRVQPGMNLLSLVPLDKVWVDANFKEGQLRRMRIGQPVKLTADLYGGNLAYHGRVVGFGAGTGSAFALLPAQNATGNWIKIVQRVPVRIELDQRELAAHPLRVGLSIEAEVDMRNMDGPALAAVPETTHVSNTDIFAGQLTAADRRIAKIIAANLATAKMGVATAP